VGVARTAGAWPQGYEAQVRAGYCGNAIAQRAVRLVAEGVEGAPLDVGDERLRALVTGRGLLEAVAAQVLLHGNAFVQVLRDGEGAVAELFALRPERVTVELGADGWPGAYLYRVGVRTTRLDPGSVIHVRRFNPVDDHYGLGCLGAASAAIAIHNAASAWSKALLDNAARPSGALVYDAGDGSVLSAEQFRRLREEMEQGFAGAANAGRPMLLEGGLKWQAMSLTPADMDFVGTKAAAAREIAMGFGVPPMLLGLPGDSTHANYREANKALWRLTVLPLAGAILSGLRDGLAEAFPGARLQVDLDRVPALVEDRERLWRMVAAADFISPEEKRQMVDWQ
jgi:HK97 family phage portal protein